MLELVGLLHHEVKLAQVLLDYVLWHRKPKRDLCINDIFLFDCLQRAPFIGSFGLLLDQLYVVFYQKEVALLKLAGVFA